MNPPPSPSGPPGRERFKELLLRLPQFEGLPPAVLDALAEAARPRHYEAGQVIYLEGDPADFVYLLETGWVKATRLSSQGREQAMLFLRPVELFGDIAVFTGGAYPGTATALEPVEAWAIPSAVLDALVDRHPALARAVIRRLAGRVLHYINLVEDLSLRTLESRLAANLLQNAARGEDGLLSVTRRSWTTIAEMAVRLGTVRDVLSRVLKGLQQEGLLRVERRRILLLDPEALQQRARR